MLWKYCYNKFITVRVLLSIWIFLRTQKILVLSENKGWISCVIRREKPGGTGKRYQIYAG